MSKLFSARVQIFGPVAANRAAPLCAVHKIVFKALLEVVRSQDVITPAALRQMQVCVCAYVCVCDYVCTCVPDQMLPTANSSCSLGHVFIY
jgi:hypothetical protein